MKRKSPKNHRRAKKAAKHKHILTPGIIIAPYIPIIKFTNDSDTGFYREHSGGLEIVVGGVTQDET